MSDAIETTIVAYEQRLKTAMLTSDIESLEQLLAPDLVFTNHLGEIISKAEDIESHKNGELMIDALELSECVIKPFDRVVSVSTRTKITGYYKAEPFTGDFRFTRIWRPDSIQKDDSRWQVVIAHSSLIA